MPKLLWTSGEKVSQVIYQEWLASGDIRTGTLRRKYGVGIYQASQRFHSGWWESAANGGVPKSVMNRTFAYIAARERIRPGQRVSLPCRNCGAWIKFLITNGATLITRGRCAKPLTVTVAFEGEAWRIRTR
jgi:hypothetical protein